MAFDIDGAKKAGYSDAEIADYLGKAQSFDIAAARKSGYSDSELVAHLAQPKARSVTAPKAQGVQNGEGSSGSTLGQKIPGNIDLSKRKVLNNPDGSISTESSFSIGTDDGEVLLPTVINGKRVSAREAIAHYEQTGEHLGIFDNANDADAYAQSLHEQQGQRYGERRKRAAYVPGMSAEEMAQAELDLKAPPPVQAPAPVETGIMAAIKDPAFWGEVGDRAASMGRGAKRFGDELVRMTSTPKPGDKQLLPENYGSDLQTQIGASIESKAIGVSEIGAERRKEYAQKRLGQASILPQVVKDFREKGVPMRSNPLLQGYLETMDIPQKDANAFIDDFLMDWPLYAKMDDAQRQTLFLEGKRVLQEAQDELAETGKRREIMQTIQQGARPDMDKWSPQALIFDAATSIPDLLVAAGGTVAGGPVVGLTLMGASIFPSSYEQGKAQGLNHRAAGTYASLMTAAELAPELPVMEALTNSPQGKAIMRKLVGGLVDTTGGKIVGMAGAEALSEMFTEVLQQGINSGMLDQNMTLPEALESIARAGAVGATMGAPLGAVSAIREAGSPNSEAIAQQAEIPLPEQQVEGGPAVPEIQPEVPNVEPAAVPATSQELASEPAQAAEQAAPEQQTTITIDRRSLADAFTIGDDGKIDAAQAGRAVRSQVDAALAAGQSVTQGGGRKRIPVTSADQVDVRSVLSGLSRIKIGPPETAAATEQEAEAPTLAQKAKEDSKRPVNITPSEDGFTVNVKGEATATYPTIEQAREEKIAAQKMLDEQAHAAATSPTNELPEPTPAQVEAGNYQKGHIKLHGLDISIENPKGSIRRSKPGAKTKWEREMTAHYGYVRSVRGGQPAGRQTDSSHVVGNALGADAKSSSDSGNRVTGGAKGFDSLDVNDKAVVKRNVLSLIKDNKIARDVIESVPISVMNVLVGQKRPTEDLLRDPAMFFDRLSTAFDDPVRSPAVVRFINSIATSHPDAFAGLGTKEKAALGVGDSVRADVKDKSAGGATNFGSHSGYYTTKAADGDHVDVFVGDNPESEKVYVIDQVIDGKYDEAKVILGVDSEDAARKLYQSNYQKGWKGLGAITEMPVEQFKEWVKTEAAKKPLAWSAKKSIYKDSAPVKTPVSTGEKPTSGKARLGESADAVWSAIKDANKGVVSAENGNRVTYPTMRVVGGDDFRLSQSGKLEVVDRKSGGVGVRDATEADAIEFYKDLNRDAVEVVLMSAPGYGSGYRDQKTVRVLHSPSGNSFAKPSETPVKPENVGQATSTNKIFTDDAAAKARALLKSKLSNLNQGLDPEVLQAGITLAGYHIEKGARTFAAYTKAMVEDLGDAVRPYLRSWYEAVRYHPSATEMAKEMDSAATIDSQSAQADTQPKVNERVPSTNTNLERDSGNATAQDAAVAEPVQVDGPAEGLEASGGQVDSARRGHPDDQGFPDGSTAVPRELSNQSVYPGEQQNGAEEFPARSADGERSDDPGIEGVPPESITAEQVDVFADDLHADARKRAEQRKADSIAISGSLENVRATLPYLQPGQQEDVHKVETRFSKPDGYGYTLTNGTGTGKTFSGLGVVKRYARRGKKEILIVVPDVKISSDWVTSAKALGLEVTPLIDTKDRGRGITITTYANLGQNDELAKRSWDFIVADEAHQLMQSANGDQTLGLNALRAITMHPGGVNTRYEMLYREDVDRMKANVEKFNANVLAMKNSSAEMLDKLQTDNARIQKEQDALHEKYKADLAKVQAEVEAAQGASRTRMLGLSATPFAYEKTIDWAEGYLFDYGKADESGRSYNRGDARDQFFMQHFGYRMRYGKLTEPDANVDRGLMQRQFNGWLKKSGVLSGRTLDVPYDYDRRFVLVDSAIGNQIDRAMEYIDDQRKAFGENRKGEVNGWALLDEVLQNDLYGKLGHLTRRYLLEAIKAKEVIPLLRQHLAMKRKIVVFHDFKKGGSHNPFAFPEVAIPSDLGQAENVKAFNAAAAVFRDKFPDLSGDLLSELISPIERFKKEFPDVLIINGDERKPDLLKRYKMLQDDSVGPIIALVQSDKNKGWSGHDTTGKYQRVLFNLGLPTQPTKSIQQEGRIYRIGQVSNAIFRYMNTGTNWELWAFAQTIAERASAAENLGMGESARALKDTYIAGFEESGHYPAGHEGEGTGGKERDQAANNALSEYDRARAFYFGTRKKDARTKAQEGADYYATPEPLGLKMVQWADARGGEDVLEPSAGHGAIARWFGEKTNRTAIEPSNTLNSRLAMVFDGKIIRGDFESLKAVNKYDTIVMNPPFGSGGRTAIDHLEKAAVHLREGGRIVALIPTGPSADAKFDKWFYDEEKEKRASNSSAKGVFKVADIKLPAVTFERAGTKVMTRIVILEKPAKGTNAPQEIQRDWTSLETINELFDQLEHVDITTRAKPVTEESGSRFITAAEARERREAEKPAAPPVDPKAIVEHITGTGKKLRGVVRTDMTLDQAKTIDPYTFKKNGGFYIRERHLAELEQKFPSQQPLLDLADDKQEALAVGVRRALAKMAGHEVDPIERKSALLEIGRLRKQLESGKLSSVEFAMQIEALHAKMLVAAKAKSMDKLGNERARGPDYIRQRLLEAKRHGDINAETADMAEWFIMKNPALVDELGISIKAVDETTKSSAGQYMPVTRIMKLIKDRAKPTTAVHEILHHMERLMPDEMQSAIRKEYWKRLTATRDKAEKAGNQELVTYLDNAAKASIAKDETAMKDMKDALLKGRVERENYQFFNPSEFWAVNMTELLSARYQTRNSVWKRIKQWVKEAIQHARSVLRMTSDSPLIKTLDSLIEGSDGQSTAKFMLHESALYENRALNDITDASFDAPTKGKEIGVGKRKTDFDTFLYDWQDKHIDTKRVVDAIQKLKGEIADENNPYQAEELYHQRAAYRTEQFLTNELKPLLEEAKKLKIEVADLEQYLWARHAKERNETIAERNIGNEEMQDGGSGMTTADAQAYMAELTPERRQKLEALAARVDKMTDATRQTLVGYGLESQSTMDLRKAAWPSYVPLHREDYENESSYGIGQGFSVKGSDSKAALGSKRKVVNILAEIAKQREKAIVRGEKNRVALALFGLAKANPNEAWWSTERMPRIRYLDKDGQAQSMVDPKWKNRENAVVVRFPNKTGRIVERGVIFNERNARAMRMAESLKNLDTSELEGFVGIAAKVSRYIASVNTQYNPVFGLRNLQRDIQEGMLNATNTAIKGQSAKIAKYSTQAIKGIWQDARAKRKGKHAGSEWGKWFDEMEREGGTTGHRQLFETSADRAKAILDEFKQLDESYVGKKSLRAIGNWLSDYNLTMESAVRVAAYRTARESGLSKPKSASIAKNLTINFNRKGRNSQQANALYAFFNAKVQGQARAIQTWAGPKGKAIIAGGLLIGVIQAVALSVLGFDDNDPPEFVKQQNLIIPYGDGRYFIWNMPQSMQLLVSMGRIPTESAIREGKSGYEAMMSMFSTVLDSFNPMGASTPLQTLMPTAVDPIAALAENENWNGQPIYQEKFDRNDPAPGFTRGKDTSSAVGKVVSRGLNFLTGGSDYVAGKLSPTPDQIDYLLDQALGGPGREFSKAQQTISALQSGEDLPDYKVPLLGHYFGNANSKSSERSRFYALATKGHEYKAELEGRAGEAAVDSVAAKQRFREYLEAHPDAEIAISAVDAANQVSKIRKAKRQAAANGQPQSVLNKYDDQAAAVISQTLARDKAFRQEASQ